jgi:hypothetical protein
VIRDVANNTARTPLSFRETFRRRLAASSNRSPSQSPVSNLLSVSTQVEHPNFVNPPKAKLKQGEERAPSNERFQERSP